MLTFHKQNPVNLGWLAETIEHVLLSCQFYHTIQTKYIIPIITANPGRSSQFYSTLLLAAMKLLPR